ncbi:chloride channel protein [Actinomyces capricornis]|uniref:Chloride channel protein n=1 Tax=Actinomyces capricornis TaxID=2755559 RepID=A0ABM7UE46_9ACTO|nr:chloride channel protein [Actinomyces capricornis]BDA65363.1 chloride channel protein [Actinomyces capricornis]
MIDEASAPGTVDGPAGGTTGGTTGPHFPARLYGVAVGYGFVAGAVTGVTFFLMRTLQHLIWDHSQARWYTVAVVMLGGILIASLRHYSLEADLDDQLDPRGPTSRQWRKIAVLGLSAVIAIGFGGAIGPEAGLLAVVAELSIIVKDRIARTRAEAELITEAGTAAALSGFYGAPPVGAVYREGGVPAGRLPIFCASLAGFVAFVLTWRVLGLESHPLELPPAQEATLPSLLALIPAVVGAVLAALYLLVRHWLTGLAPRLGSPRMQTLIGSALLAVLLGAWPVLRFSGHDDFGVLVSYTEEGAWGLLVLLALGKVVATALSLAAGWRGGDFFPLMFAGAGAGAATLALLPALDAQTAMVAGMAAATAVALRKPVAVFVLVWFLLPDVTVLALAVACIVGVLAARTLPARLSAGHGH